MLSEHELTQICFSQNKTQSKHKLLSIQLWQMWLSHRYHVCLTSLSFKTILILILFASSYKDIVEKKKCDIQSRNIASSKCCFLCLTLLSTTLKHVCKVVDSVGVDKNNLTLVLADQWKKTHQYFLISRKVEISKT